MISARRRQHHEAFVGAQSCEVLVTEITGQIEQLGFLSCFGIIPHDPINLPAALLYIGHIIT